MTRIIVIALVLIINFTTMDLVTVNPLCPTNKIAPYKRPPKWQNRSPRTFGYLAELFSADDTGQGQAPGDQQPQEDEAGCDDIEDYDDSDLSSLTQQNQRKHDNENRFLFNLLGGWNSPSPNPQRPPSNSPRPPSNPQRPPSDPTRPPSEPQKPPSAPQRPPWKPPSPQRPPYANKPPPGGYFMNNYYNPYNYEPSDNLKPVNEEYDDIGSTSTFVPNVIGGVSGQVVAFNPVQVPPPKPPVQSRPPCYYYTTTTTQKPRAGRHYSNSVFGSFFDLLLK